MIEDLGSTNGTFLNGRKISRPEVLSAGDRIQVGATTLVVQVSVQAAPAPAAAAAPDADTRSSEHMPMPAPVSAPPPLSLQLQFDPATGEVRIDLGDASEPLRLIYEEGRWRLAPE